MSSMLGTQGFVLATAMAVSAGTIILFDLFKDKTFPFAASTQLPKTQDDSSNKILKSCLSSGNKKDEAKKKKKKRVQFAADVKDSNGNGEEYRRGHRRNLSGVKQGNGCGNESFEFSKMPANRLALYQGILRDRVHRIEYSY